MFLQWPVLAIQPVTTSVGVCCPAAMFSATERQM